MGFSVEINGRVINSNSKHFGYLEASGQKKFFTLDHKRKLWKMPTFEGTSIKLFYMDKSDTFISRPMPSSLIQKGGAAYFGTILNFKDAMGKYDTDPEYATHLNNTCRGLSVLLSSHQVRDSAEKSNTNPSLRYFVLDRSGGVTYSLDFR